MKSWLIFAPIISLIIMVAMMIKQKPWEKPWNELSLKEKKQRAIVMVLGVILLLIGSLYYALNS